MAPATGLNRDLSTLRDKKSIEERKEKDKEEEETLDKHQKDQHENRYTEKAERKAVNIRLIYL